MTIRLLQNFTSFTFVEDAFRPEDRVPKEWAREQGPKALTGFRPEVVLTMSSQGGMWLKASPAVNE